MVIRVKVDPAVSMAPCECGERIWMVDGQIVDASTAIPLLRGKAKRVAVAA